jgi:hypothetical protein
MKQYWYLGQEDLAKLLHYSEEPQWCVALTGLLYCFLKHYGLIPSYDQWLHFCQINFQQLSTIESVTNSNSHQESLLEAENTIKKISGLNYRMSLLKNVYTDITHPREALYVNQILNQLRNVNDFIFICFYFKNICLSSDLPQGSPLHNLF